MKKVIALIVSLSIILSVALPLSSILSSADNNEPVIFYDCDSLTGAELYGGSLSATALGSHNGTNDSFMTDLSGKNSHELGIILPSSVNAASAVYLEFDYYISSLDLTTGILDSQIELSSDRNNDVAEIHWNAAALNEQNTVVGWNSIKLAISDKSGADGVFNAGAILRFRHYIVFDRTVNGSIGYDNIRLTFETPSSGGATQTESTVWTSCDENEAGSGWWFNPERNEGLSFENRNGEKDAVTATVNGTAVSAAYRNMDGLDISDKEYMEFDLYVSHADIFSGAVGDAQLELTSCDWVDNYEIHYNKASLAEIPLSAGWNHVKIALSDFVSGSSTVFDATSLKFMRLYVIYSNSAVELTVKFDNICFTKEVIVPVTPPSVDTVDWSGKNGWWFNPADSTDLVRDTYNTENDAVIMAKDGNSLVAAYRAEAVDISGMLTFEFDLYLSDANITSAVTGGELELTSSNWCDAQEISIGADYLKTLDLTNGWNHIKISLNDFTALDGLFNKASLNFMRFYLVFDSSVQHNVMLSNLTFTKSEVEDDSDSGDGDPDDGGSGDNEPTDPPVVPPTDTVDWSGKNGWWFDPNTLTDLNRDTYVNTDDAVVMTDAGNALVAAYRTDAVDISQMLTVEFDLYLEDISIISTATGGELELTSSNWCDAQEINIGVDYLKTLDLTNGWNHIKISLLEFNELDNLFDETALNFLRFYLSFDSSASRVVKLSNFIFTKNVVEDPNPDDGDSDDSGSGDNEPAVPPVVPPTDAVDWSGKNGWWFDPNTLADLSRDTYKTENDAAVMPNSGNALAAAYRTDAVDISKMGYMEFDLYLEDASIISTATSGELELTSSNWCDAQEINISLNDLKAVSWKNGWNHVKIALSEFTALDGLFNKSALNFMRFFLGFENSADRTVMISNVIFTKDENSDSIVEEVRDNTAGYITGCDSRVGWFTNSGTKISLDTEDKRQGEASLKFASVANKGIEMRYTFDAMDISKAKYLKFDLYISDTSVLESAIDMQVEISSSGMADVNELNWNLSFIKGMELKDGWNTVCLPLMWAASTDEDINLSKICYFRLYCVFEGEKEFIWKIDGLKTETEAGDGKTLLTLDCDTVSGWQAGENTTITRDTAERKQGEASVRFNTSGKGIAVSAAFSGVDIKGANAIQFYLRVPDALILEMATDMQFELTSGGGPDVHELHWGKDVIVSRVTEDGWNLVTLLFEEAVESEDGFDPSNFNFLRFYIVSAEENEYIINLDDIKFVKIDDTAAVKNAYKTVFERIDGTLILSKCDSLLGWTTGDNSVMTLDRDNKVSGKASISIDSEHGILYRYVFDSVDASFANYLEFDLYISSLAIFNATDMQVELSSNFDDDDAEINWNREDFLKLDLKQGWNKIRLYFSNADKSSVLSNEFVPSKLCFFRFYISSEEAVSLKLDNLCVGVGEEPVGFKEVTAEELKEKTASANKPADEEVKTDKKFSAIWIVIPAAIVLAAGTVIAVVFIIRGRKDKRRL